MKSKLDLLPYSGYFKGYRVAKFKYILLSSTQNQIIARHYFSSYPTNN